MKNNKLLIAALVFFVLINTTYFWYGNLGIWAMPIFLVLVAFYLALAGGFLWVLYQAAQSRFQCKKQLAVLGFTAAVLVATFLFPRGIIGFGQMEGKTLLTANAEGAANCLTTFKLLEGQRFMESSVCFGTSEVWGRYTQKGDTLFFHDVKLSRSNEPYYQFAVIKLGVDKGVVISNILYRYKDANDTMPRMLWIRENNLN